MWYHNTILKDSKKKIKNVDEGILWKVALKIVQVTELCLKNGFEGSWGEAIKKFMID